MSKKINNNNFINIQSFMVTDLKLKGNRLLIYAIVHGFSQTAGQECTASLSYFAAWTNSSVRGVEKAMNSLVRDGLIKKIKCKGQGNKYIALKTEQSSELNSMEQSTTEQSSVANHEQSSIEHCQNEQSSKVNHEQSSIEQSSEQSPKELSSEYLRTEFEKLRNKVRKNTELSSNNNILYNNNILNNKSQNQSSWENSQKISQDDDLRDLDNNPDFDRVVNLCNTLSKVEQTDRAKSEIRDALSAGFAVDMICQIMQDAAPSLIHNELLWRVVYKRLARFKDRGVYTKAAYLEIRDANVDNKEFYMSNGGGDPHVMGIDESSAYFEEEDYKRECRARETRSGDKPIDN